MTNALSALERALTDELWRQDRRWKRSSKKDAANSEDPRRGVPEATFGYDWRLENPFRRWETSRWRICWLCDSRRLLLSDEDWQPTGDVDVTDELCACETKESAEGGERDGRIWLLGVLRTRGSVDRALDELRRNAIGDRNSLIAAADAVAKASRDEQWGPAVTKLG